MHNAIRFRRFAVVATISTLSVATVLAPTLAQAQQQAGSNQGTTTASTPRPDSALPPNYQLGSGDHVRVSVYGQADMTGEYLVDGSGEIAFPLIGRLHVGGMTGDQVAAAIEHKLSPDYLKDPHVSVEVLTYRPFYIVGEVKTPGSYAYVSGMTVLNAVALAGGFTYRARENSFYVTRSEKGGSKEKLDADSTSPVLPGDIITVRERYF
ncbi:MAG TPA: polysaccharide biosynthesis/export family protein [Magnetospirillaceae bacterium]|jgi:polysaccharide export outer membrane protein